MNGALTVVGMGPGDPRYLTPEADAALAAAQALYDMIKLRAVPPKV